MPINFCMYGADFDAYNFLLKAESLPENYDIWEDVQVMKQEGPGCTLYFNSKSGIGAIPFAFGKFIVTNKILLNNQSIIGRHTTKELSININISELEYLKEKINLTILKPRLMKLLSDLEIKVYISGS